MSNYEERMSKKYNFFSNDKDVNDTSANEPKVSSETTSNMDSDDGSYFCLEKSFRSIR